MILFPAIDLRRGQVVRLRQGDPAAQTLYGDDPAEVARRWRGLGAAWLHVVNLDGAFGDAQDVPANLRCLAAISSATGLPIQFGGGVRTLADISRALELGAARVVLGTAAVRDPELVVQALAQFGAGRVVVGIDARDGMVAVQGWQTVTDIPAPELARRMAGQGVQRVVYTDIRRDGMLAGAAVAATAALARGGLRVIASGGVASLADITALAEHEQEGIEGVIIGQALYSGAIDLREALAAACGRP
jgi:phosphoribosylformimino-5-aminoimidazole carboxamide ribotide isomerase